MPFQLCTDKQHTSRAVHYLVARHSPGTTSSVSATAIPCMSPPRFPKILPYLSRGPMWLGDAPQSAEESDTTAYLS